MNTRDAIAWFKQTFGTRIADGLSGTPFSIDLVTAIANQETGYIWSPLVAKGLPEADVLRLCVGDTLDGDKGRSAFPRSKAELLAAPRGAVMFAIARQALVDMARVTPGYGFALNNPNKFCHGFGIFQYDIQFFKTNAGWFLSKSWEKFDSCLDQLLVELREALGRQGWSGKTSLTEDEQVYVAIAYNKGTADPARGFKQGHASDGRYYGENIFDYLRIAQTVEAGGTLGPRSASAQPPPSFFSRIGDVYEVQVKGVPLRLRSAPEVPADDENANVIARLPDGQLVQLVKGSKTSGQFLEVETSLDGVYYRGFAAAKFLNRIKRAKKAVQAMKSATRRVPAKKSAAKKATGGKKTKLPTRRVGKARKLTSGRVRRKRS